MYSLFTIRYRIKIACHPSIPSASTHLATKGEILHPQNQDESQCTVPAFSINRPDFAKSTTINKSLLIYYLEDRDMLKPMRIHDVGVDINSGGTAPRSVAQPKKVHKINVVICKAN